MKLPFIEPKPDKDWFRRVILGEEIPERPPLIELFLDQEVLEDIAVNYLGLEWVPYQQENKELRAKYWDNYMKVYYNLGYDFVWIDGRIPFPTKTRRTEDTAENSRGIRSWDEEGEGPISSWEDFHEYPWPKEEDLDLWDCEYVSSHLPEGMGFFVFPCRGFMEVPTEILLGYENLCILLYDEPELVEAVFQRVGEIEMRFYEKVLHLPNLMGFFPGDDMGFNTQTLISPDALRQLVLPWHKKAAKLAHDNGLLYLLHSCGQLSAIMDDLIDDVKIDGKHSFQDSIISIADFKKTYGNRVAALGGVDIDKIARMEQEELRKYVRQVISQCLPMGRFALGTGNSVANYIPTENYLAMVEEGLTWGRGKTNV